MARNRRFGGGFAEVMAGYNFGKQAATDWQNARVGDEISAVEKDYAPRQTEAVSGEDALAAGQQALQDRLETTTTAEEAQRTLKEFAPTIAALKAQQATPAGVVHSIGTGTGFRQQADEFAPGEIDAAKSVARAGIYSRAGREADAATALLNQARRRELGDQEEIRTVMRGPRTQAPLLAAAATDIADVTGDAQPTSASGPMPGGGQPAGVDPRLTVVQGGTAKPVNDQLDRTSADAYLQRKAPEVINTYLKQGNTKAAFEYRNFIDSETGRNYTQTWAQGARKLAIGDHQGALNDWQVLYNEQLYADGNTVKLTNLDGGQVQVDQFDKGGNKLGSKTMPIDALARQAGMALAPEKLVEFQAQQEAKRASEGATLTRQEQLEQLRQEGRDKSDDRRDERLGKRLDAQGAALDRRLAAQADRGLTTAQAAKNDSIDAARVQLQGMSQEDVARKTQSSLSSGRTNPEYDAGLARAAKLATSRKIGDDPAHDEFSQGKSQQNAQATQRAEVATRFRSDKSMQNFTLGNATQNGHEVKDKAGKLVGYFR